MRAATVVTGHFLRAGTCCRITLEAIDVESNRSLWRDTLDVPAGNLVATQTQIGLRVRGGLAAALGWPASTAAAAPTDEEAYGLFLRTAALDAGSGQQRPCYRHARTVGRARSRYPPAWVALARRYYVDSRYGSGERNAMDRYETAMARALPARSRLHRGLGRAGPGSNRARGSGPGATGRRSISCAAGPDSIDAHFVLSYVLRYAGLLDEAAMQCETAFLLDPRSQTSGLRSCAFVFVLRGDYVDGEELCRSRSRLRLREGAVDSDPGARREGGRGGRARFAEHAAMEQLRLAAGLHGASSAVRDRRRWRRR